MKKFLSIILVIVSLLVLLAACSGNGSADAPYIGENGNWWVGDTDTGVSAQGPRGEQGAQGEAGVAGVAGINGLTPFIGENGNWWIGETDTGVAAQGPKGAGRYTISTRTWSFPTRRFLCVSAFIRGVARDTTPSCTTMLCLNRSRSSTG